MIPNSERQEGPDGGDKTLLETKKVSEKKFCTLQTKVSNRDITVDGNAISCWVMQN